MLYIAVIILLTVGRSLYGVLESDGEMEKISKNGIGFSELFEVWDHLDMKMRTQEENNTATTTESFDTDDKIDKVDKVEGDQEGRQNDNDALLHQFMPFAMILLFTYLAVMSFCGCVLTRTVNVIQRV